MSLSLNYLFLFLDSFKASLIFYAVTESSIWAMLIFDHYNKHLIFIITLAGSILGSVMNWLIGKNLIFLKKKSFFKKKSKEIKRAEKTWDQYMVWVLLFSPIKILGNPFALFSGFLGTNFKKFFILVFLGKTIYYFWIVYFTN